MELIPIKTRILHPPQDDLLSVLKESLPALKEGDVVLISSKVVAINEGRTVKVSEVNKATLIAKEADLVIPRPYWPAPLTVTRHAFLGAAGIDESNGDGHYVLLPEDTFRSAHELYSWLKVESKLQQLGVIITDSHSAPLRYGASGVALGWWGIEPIEDCRGRADLFGREIQYEQANIVDGLAAGATVVMGEVAECIPVVIAREVPRLVYTDKDTKDMLLVPFKDDTFRVLYEKFLP